MLEFRRFLYYALLLVMAVSLVSSCGGSKQSANIRRIERDSRRNPPPTDMEANAANSRTVRRVLRNEERRDRDAERDAQRASNEAIQRHRDMQTPETRERMDRNLRETNRRYNEPFFSRLFRRKTEQEKIDRQREREAQRRLDARRG